MMCVYQSPLVARRSSYALAVRSLTLLPSPAYTGSRSCTMILTKCGSSAKPGAHTATLWHHCKRRILHSRILMENYTRYHNTEGRRSCSSLGPHGEVAASTCRSGRHSMRNSKRRILLSSRSRSIPVAFRLSKIGFVPPSRCKYRKNWGTSWAGKSRC